MSQADWNALRTWLFDVFADSTAEALYAAHVAEARAAGLEPPA